MKPIDRRSFLIGAAGAAGSIMLPPCAPLFAKSRKRLKIGYLPITDAAPLLIAHAKGFFAEEGLMAEIGKVERVIKKLMPDAPHQTMLVMDATLGQNVIKQSKVFSQFLDITGLALTKLDGTARGGALISVAGNLKLPVLFIGTGEGLSDISKFDSRKFVERLW